MIRIKKEKTEYVQLTPPRITPKQMNYIDKMAKKFKMKKAQVIRYIIDDFMEYHEL